VNPDVDAVTAAAQVRGAKQLLPSRFRHRATRLGQPEHGRLQSVGTIDQQPQTLIRIQLRNFYPTAIGIPRDRPLRVFDYERAPPASVSAIRSCPLDHVGPIDLGISDRFADKRFRDIHPPCGSAFGDCRRQPEPLIAAQPAVCGHLEHG
jgi:hypothetical protein